MCVNVDCTSWAALAWGWIFPRGSPTYFCHPLHNPPYADALCFSLSVITLSLFLSLSLTHSHLPQCWTASNRARSLKEMSVHSLNIPQSTAVLAVLISFYEASWNCSIVISRGTFLCYICVCACVCTCFVFRCVQPLTSFLSFYGFTLNRLCCVTRKGNSFSQPVSHSLPLSGTTPPTPSASLFFSSSPLTISLLLKGMATAGQTSRQGYA